MKPSSRKRDRKYERGQILILLAFVMIGLMLCSALAIDVGFAYVTKARLANSRDRRHELRSAVAYIVVSIGLFMVPPFLCPQGLSEGGSTHIRAEFGQHLRASVPLEHPDYVDFL